MGRYFQDKDFGQKKWTGIAEAVTHWFPYGVDIPLTRSDMYRRMTSKDSLYSYAHEYLGDEHLWWVLMIANKDKKWNLPWDAQVGDLVRIPSLGNDYVQSLKQWYVNEASK